MKRLQSGCIKLPSQRTLRDYTHYTNARIRLSAEVDQHLIDIADLSKNLNKYIVLIMDKVHIKEAPFASSMLVHGQGTFWKLNYPYAQFACDSLCGEQLFNPVWEAIARLKIGLSCTGTDM